MAFLLALSRLSVYFRTYTNFPPEKADRPTLVKEIRPPRGGIKDVGKDLGEDVGCGRGLPCKQVPRLKSRLKPIRKCVQKTYIKVIHETAS
jgi:hypothetical protein